MGKKEESLTLKQSKWLKIYLETGNATEAAMQVYDCKDRNVASTIGWENLRKLDYSDFLEEAGITDKLLQEKILEGLDASKPISALILISGDKSMRTKDNEGQIEVPDFLTRHKYLETALKLKKRLTDRIEHTGEGGGPIEFANLTDEELDKFINSKLGQNPVSGVVAGTGQKDKGEPT